MNVRKRSGAMGALTTRQDATTEAVTGVVAPRGKVYRDNVPVAIDNSVSVKPQSVGPTKVDNAVSWPGKFRY